MSGRGKLRLYRHLDARFDQSDEDPRASLVNLVDVMLVFACGLRVSLAAHHGLFNGQPAKVTRGEMGRVLATLIRLLRDFDRAEEALHDAFLAATENWNVHWSPVG
mgnify:CR=1 FL=1